MNAYVFLGPTLFAEEACAELDAIYLPPVSQGDVYRVALTRPEAIGIIDGYFECVPSVWHKEVLWAMAQGIHVYGCSSMGALRAAELAAFGMEGIGKIFEAYRDGALVDDDDVAVAHAPASRGYQPQTVAMVNIRATLAAAESAGIIGKFARRKLERVAKRLPYPERCYTAVLERAAGRVRSEETEALRLWLPAGQVDQKREDALAMLRIMRTRLEAGLVPKQVDFTFEYTANWEIARSRAGSLHLDPQGRRNVMFTERLLDELRLEGAAYEETRQAALVRFLAVEEAWRLGMVPVPEMIAAAGERFRRERGIEEQDRFERWLGENHLNQESFLALMRDEVCLEWVRDLAETETSGFATDHLRVRGHYSRLANRAQEKQRTLESRGLQNPGALDAGLTDEELLRRYFEERLGRPVAANLADYCHAAGYPDEGSFRRAILREYCYTEFR